MSSKMLDSLIKLVEAISLWIWMSSQGHKFVALKSVWVLP